MPKGKASRGTRADARLAAASAAGGFAVLSLASATLALNASGSTEVAARRAVGWLSLLATLVLTLVAARGGDKVVTRVSGGLAVLLVGGELAAGGTGTEVLLGLMVAPVVHASVFHGRRGALATALAAVGIALGASALAGADLLLVASWLVPAAAVAALASVPLDDLRRQREGLARREAEARRLADEDGLTGLANYRAFWRALQAEAARAERHGQTFTLVVLDLDNFKQVNDQYGHLVGDAALRTAAAALQAAVRAEDLVCRQGGDEFAVVAVAAADEEAAALANRLVHAVGEWPIPPEVPCRLTASAGWATFGKPARSAEELVEQAGAALRATKRRGRDHREADRTPGAVRSVGASALRARVSDASPVGARPALRLGMLASLGRALAAAKSERAIAETAVAHAAGAVDADRVAVVRCADPRRPAFLVAVSGGRGAHEPRRPPDRPPLSTALRERRTAVIALPGRDGLHGSSAVAVAAVPLVAEGELWGALELESCRAGAFAGAEMAVVEAMGEVVGRALVVERTLAQLPSARWDANGAYGPASEHSDAHGREVARLAELIGRRVGLPGAPLRQLHVAALFHEIGTVCVPPELTGKPGQLSDDEFAVLRAHPLVGQRLLGAVPDLALAGAIVRAVRERYDGAGYPDGLAGEEIPLAARVLHGCDAFVAMTTSRPYRRALSPAAALEELRRNSGSQFDPAVVGALVDSVAVEVDASTA